MRNNKARIDFPRLNHGQQWLRVGLNMGLAGFDRQSLVHQCTQRHFVTKSDIHTRDRYGPTHPAGHNGLAQHMEPIRGQFDRRLDLIKYRICTAVSRRFAAHRIDTAVRAPSIRCPGHQFLVHIDF